ncbi:hypothetical protein [Streptomyces sp. GESEQ-35]|uniref:AbiTii domain-containing protein n=1 Tax=Streptomyces sp. GESEQ-35 TaxID=2812657 RepID=UPI001B324E7A
MLAGYAHHEELRAWALKELKGYATADELPSHRRVSAALEITVNFSLPGTLLRNEIRRVSPGRLPQHARDRGIGESAPIRQGVRELEAIVARGDRVVRLCPPGSTEYVLLMTQEQHQLGNEEADITSLHWDVSVASIEGVLDNIRTALVAPNLGHLDRRRGSGDDRRRHRHRDRGEVRLRRGRLDRLGDDVVNDSRPLAPTLRQVIALGGHAHSEPLRTWALRELQGYEGTDVPIPDYRRISAPLVMDGLAGMCTAPGPQRPARRRSRAPTLLSTWALGYDEEGGRVACVNALTHACFEEASCRGSGTSGARRPTSRLGYVMWRCGCC